jgi:phage terminase large subunit-like protein
MQNDWLTKEVHFPLCNFLQSPYPKKKLIELPRGFLKTTIASVYYSIWRSLDNPSIRVLITQNTFDNAAKRVREIRSIFEKHELFRALYPELIPNFNSKSVRWSDECAEINRPTVYPEGTFEAAGVGTKLTSRHYDLIIEDDTVTAESSDLGEEEIAPNMEDVAKAIGWHKMATNLCIDYKMFERIVIGTRWFQDDMIAYVKDKELGYAKFFIDVYGRKFLGEDKEEIPVYPKRFDDEVLEAQKEELGVYMFATQKLLDPTPLERMIFKPHWTRYYNVAPVTKNILCIDPAIGETKRHCDCAFIVAGGADNGLIYLLDTTSGQFNLTEQVKLTFALIRKYEVKKLVVETIAYQEALAQAIVLERDRVNEKGEKVNEDVHFSIVREVPGGKDSKEKRIESMIPYFEYGKVLLTKDMKKLEKQLREYPYGKKRDLIDVMAYALRNIGYSKIKAKKEVFDPNSFEAILKNLKDKANKGDYPFARARKYAENASPSIW